MSILEVVTSDYDSGRIRLEKLLSEGIALEYSPDEVGVTYSHGECPLLAILNQRPKVCPLILFF